MVVHGIPGDYTLAEGDLISVDVGVTKDGFVADSAYTFAVGEVTPEAQRLLDVVQGRARGRHRAGQPGQPRRRHLGGRAAPHRGGRLLASCAASSATGSAGRCTRIRRSRTSASRTPGPELTVGMTLAIEPMITAGSPEVFVAEDGWSIFTDDGSLAAHFEHTVAVTDEGPRVLTLSERLSESSPVGSVLR